MLLPIDESSLLLYPLNEVVVADVVCVTDLVAGIAKEAVVNLSCHSCGGNVDE